MEERLTPAPHTGLQTQLAPPDRSLRLAHVAPPMALRSASRGHRRWLLAPALALTAAGLLWGSGLVAAGTASGKPVPEPRLGTQTVSRSVLHVGGAACGASITGSGWVAGPGIVVTAAHVVAGVARPTVQDGRTELRAELVHFDARNDLALLRVRGLHAPALELAPDSPTGAAGRTIGFPGGGALRVDRTNLSDTETMLAPDVYGQGPLERRLTRFDGVVEGGSSGGPVVDGGGRVLTTVLGAATGPAGPTGMGVPNEIVSAALDGAAATPAVATGECAPAAPQQLASAPAV